MSLFANVEGNVKEVTQLYGNVNGEKKEIVSLWANKDGVPVQVYGSGAQATIKAIPKGFCLCVVIYQQYHKYVSSTGTTYVAYSPTLIYLIDRLGNVYTLTYEQKEGTQTVNFQTNFEDAASDKVYYVARKSVDAAGTNTSSSYYTTTLFDTFDTTSSLFPSFYCDYAGTKKASYLSAVGTFCPGTKYYNGKYSSYDALVDFLTDTTYAILPYNSSTYPGQEADDKHNVHQRVWYFARTRIGDVVVKGCSPESYYKRYQYEVMVYLYDRFDTNRTLDDEHLVFESHEQADYLAMCSKDTQGGLLSSIFGNTYCQIIPDFCSNEAIVFIYTSGAMITITRLSLDGQVVRNTIDVTELFLDASKVTAYPFKNINVYGSGIIACIESSKKVYIYYVPDLEALLDGTFTRWLKILESDIPSVTSDVSGYTVSRYIKVYPIPMKDSSLEYLVNNSDYVQQV